MRGAVKRRWMRRRDDKRLQFLYDEARGEMWGAVGALVLALVLGGLVCWGGQ